MATPPSPEFILLAGTLLDALPSARVLDPLLLQLHALFGPTLVSALQLVDRRDVVRVNLPGDRTLYQVTSSAGAPYTLYLDVPPPPRLLPPPAPAVAEDGVEAAAEQAPISNDARAEPASPPPVRAPSALAYTLKTAYCPCAGFAYNTLTGDRAVVCKHILAVLVAHRLDKVVDTDVPLAAAAGLVGAGVGGEG